MVSLETRFIGLDYSYTVTMFLDWEFLRTVVMILGKEVLYDVNMFIVCADVSAADLFL